MRNQQMAIRDGHYDSFWLSGCTGILYRIASSPVVMGFVWSKTGNSQVCEAGGVVPHCAHGLCMQDLHHWQATLKCTIGVTLSLYPVYGELYPPPAAPEGADSSCCTWQLCTSSVQSPIILRQKLDKPVDLKTPATTRAATARAATTTVL